MAIGAEVVEPSKVSAGYQHEFDRLDAEQFSSFFFGEADLEASLRTGAWDFSYHIAGKCMPFLTSTGDVLDVGCGAGRMLLHAARHFDRACGIDLHDRGQFIESSAVSGASKTSHIARMVAAPSRIRLTRST